MKILVLGHPRCGSRSLSREFSEVGVDLGHEVVNADGMVSWWHTGRHLGTTTQGLERFNISRNPERNATPELILHYVRNPADAIPSIIVENESQDRLNNSFRFRTTVIKQQFGIDLSTLSPRDAAVSSYVYWNRIASSLSHLDSPILVERPNLNDIGMLNGIRDDAQDVGHQAHVLNRTIHKFGVDKPTMSWEAIVDGLPVPLQDELDTYKSVYE